jgi:hypothetical protein
MRTDARACTRMHCCWPARARTAARPATCGRWFRSGGRGLTSSRVPRAGAASRDDRGRRCGTDVPAASRRERGLRMRISAAGVAARGGAARAGGRARHAAAAGRRRRGAASVPPQSGRVTSCPISNKRASGRAACATRCLPQDHILTCGRRSNGLRSQQERPHELRPGPGPARVRHLVGFHYSCRK